MRAATLQTNYRKKNFKKNPIEEDERKSVKRKRTWHLSGFIKISKRPLCCVPLFVDELLLLSTGPLPLLLLELKLLLLFGGMVVAVLIGLLLLPIDIGLATLSTIN